MAFQKALNAVRCGYNDGMSHLWFRTGHLKFADVKFGNLPNPSKS